jgi:hypothetical protein
MLSQKSPMLTAHRPSFPTCLFHPRRVNLFYHLDSPSTASLPYLRLQEQTRPEVSSSMAVTGFFPRALSFLYALSHLEGVSHRPTCLMQSRTACHIKHREIGQRLPKNQFNNRGIVSQIWFRDCTRVIL